MDRCTEQAEAFNLMDFKRESEKESQRETAGCGGLKDSYRKRCSSTAGTNVDP